MKKYPLILILLTSCSLPALRSPSSLDNGPFRFNCNDVINQFRTMSDLKTYKKYKKFAKYNDTLIFQKFEKDTLNKINFWTRTGRRKNNVAQMKHNGAFSAIDSAFQIDSEFGIARQFRSLFYEAESSYFMAKRAFREAAMLEKFARDIRELGINDEVLKNLRHHEQETLVGNFASLKIKNPQENKDKFQLALLNDVAALNELVIEQAFGLARVLDQYTVVRTYIEQKLDDPQFASKAAKVMDKLDTKKILTSCQACGDVDNYTNPLVKNMETLVNKINIVRVLYLRRQLVQEQWMTILSRMPSQYAYRFVDRIIEKIPWLNHSDFRKWMRQHFVDFVDRNKHFPQIDRVLFSDAQMPDLVKLMHENFSAGGARDYLITFARRTDANEKWTKIYDWLKNNKPQEARHQYSLFFEEMNKAWDEAVKRGPMPEWHHPQTDNTMRYVIDLFFYGSALYGSYYVGGGVSDGVTDIAIDLIHADDIHQESEQALSNEKLTTK
jgi:hypothetical protein